MNAESAALQSILTAAREGALDDAVARMEKTQAPAKALAETWYHLAELAQKTGAYDTAYLAGRKAVALAPDDPLAHMTLGLALTWLHRHAEACDSFLTAARLQPRIAAFWRNVGLSYQFQNKLDEAERAFLLFIEKSEGGLLPEGARPAEKDYSLGYWDLALIDLLRGNLTRGFARFRARFKAISWLSRPTLPRPLWRGEDLRDKTILVHDEQGLGDSLMMLRYVPLMKQNGARVRLAVHAPLVPLLEGWDAALSVSPRDTTLPLDFDYFASIFDLPLAFGTTLETIPSSLAYLPRPAERAETRLDPFEGPKIGIAWSGGTAHIYDAMRSLPLPVFAKLFALEGVRFYSFVKEMRTGETALLTRQPAVVELGPRLHHFADTARFVQQMDLVISCDTSLAHLAGALGKPVWTLLPYAPDWRWMLDRTDSPWYPSMRLFRQSRSGDWESVIGHVLTALREAIS